MEFTVNALTNISFTISPRFYLLVQMFALILSAAVILLFILLISYHINVSSKVKQRKQMKEHIEKAAAKAAVASTQDLAESELPLLEELFSYKGIGVLAEVLYSMEDEHKEALIEILTKMNAAEFLRRQLRTGNEDYLVDVLSMVGDLKLIELDKEISNIILNKRDNLDVQFEAFLTLSRLGSRDNIVRICMDKRFVQQLTFRSLQEIISAFAGDKRSLYSKLLSAPDAYITRICIKQIGIEEITALAPDVARFLSNKNFNVVIDAAKALGSLRYKPTTEKVLALLQHERWEVRNAAVSAAATIDVNSYQDLLITALQDREWFVRYNAGIALSHIEDITEIHEKVLATKDRFAIEMLEYMTQMAEIRRKIV